MLRSFVVTVNLLRFLSNMSSVVSATTNGTKKKRHREDNLWGAAYTRMKKDPDGSKILTKYQKVVGEHLKETGRPLAKLGSTEGRLKLVKYINVKAQTLQPHNSTCNKVVRAVLKTKDVVSTGAAASPPAAIAVAGLFVALSMGQNYLSESKAMLECTEVVAKIMGRRAVEESEILPKSPLEAKELKELREQLRCSYVDLYFKLLSVIAKLVYKLDSRLSWWADNLVGWSDWASERKSLDDLERECERDLKAIHHYITSPSGQPSPYTRKDRNLLHVNASRGYDVRVAELLEGHAFDVNAKTAQQWTALSLAAEGGHINCCRNILDVRNVEINSQNKSGHTALHIAARKDRVEVVRLLLKKGASLKTKDTNGQTALHLAADSGRHKVVDVLRKANGIELNAQDNEGRTALHLATLKKKVQVVRALAENRAKIDTKDKKNRTAFLDAAETGNSEIIKILQEHGAQINQVTARNQWSALHICASSGRLRCLNLLLSFQGIELDLENSGKRTPLHLATLQSKTSVVKALCDKGAKVDTRDTKGRTPFLVAAKSGNLEIVKKLKEKGADINQVTGQNKWSALHDAAAGDKVEVVKYLVSEGIKTDLKVQGGSKKGKTAREIAESMKLSAVLEVLQDS